MPTQKVMVVDDNKDTLELLQTLLKANGFQPFVVASGEECLQKVKNVKPDLILLDIMMPGLSGWDTFEKLRQMADLHESKDYKNFADKSPFRIAFLTVIEASDERKQTLFKEGICDYLTKPFITLELIKKIRGILASNAPFFTFRTFGFT